MILQKNKFDILNIVKYNGLREIFAYNEFEAVEAILIYKNMYLTDSIRIEAVDNDFDYRHQDKFAVCIGNSYICIMPSRQAAINLLIIINSILVGGESAESIIDDALDAINTILLKA